MYFFFVHSDRRIIDNSNKVRKPNIFFHNIIINIEFFYKVSLSTSIKSFGYNILKFTIFDALN